MVYKFKRSLRFIKKEKKTHCKVKANSLPTQFRMLEKNPDVDIFGEFQNTEKKSAIKERLIKIAKIINLRLQAIISAIKKRRRPPVPSALIVGALCASVLFTALAAVLSVLLIFGRYGGSYREIVIPNLISMSEEEAKAVGNGVFEYEIEYRTNPDAEAGKIVFQSPSPNVVRRIYSSNEKLTIKITVTTEQKQIKIPATIGLSLRDATLSLKNAGLGYKVISEYSSTAPFGTVTFCSHSKGTLADKNEMIILRSSLGKKTVYKSVPELMGLGESEAVDKLTENSLKVGKITYSASSYPLGTVIAQGVSAGSEVAEQSEISLTVSGGPRYQENE